MLFLTTLKSLARKHFADCFADYLITQEQVSKSYWLERRYLPSIIRAYISRVLGY